MRAIGPTTLRQSALFLSFLVSGGWFVFPRVPISVLIAAICFVASNLKGGIDHRLKPIYLLLAIVLVEMLLRPGLRFESFASKVFLFLASVLLLNLYLGEKRDTLARDLYPILKWMAIQGIATFVLANTVNSLFIPGFLDKTTYSFLYIFFYHVPPGPPQIPIRSPGVFWEPGIFQMYLNLYLYLALFVFKSVRQSILAVLAVMCTVSTTGLFICLILLGIRFMQSLRTSSHRRKLTIGVVGLIVAIPLGVIAYDNAMNKFSGDEQGSFFARQYDLYTGINVVIAHPWVGVGFDADQYLVVARDLGYADTELSIKNTFERTNTSGILYLLFSMGIPLSIPFLLGLLRPRIFPHPFLVGSIIFITQISEPFTYSVFGLFIIFSGLTAEEAFAARTSRLAAIT